jgi:drug/metabolite transporter (DMT)-like permease
VTPRKYLVLSAIVLFGSIGDVMLSRGMKLQATDAGGVPFREFPHLISALFTPWVAGGTVLLICFLAAYMSALSWADLTYVLPATSLGYVVVALLSQFMLGENVTLTRWLGILLITAGVGFVASGPSHTSRRERAKIRAGDQ